MWRRSIPMLVLVILAAVACGDDGESVFEQGGPGQGAEVVGEQGGDDAGVGEQGGGDEVVGQQGGDDAGVGEQGGGEAVVGGLSAAEQAMADQIAADVLAEGVADETGLAIDQEAAQCLGNQVVAAIGLDRLLELQAQGGSGDIGTAMELMTPEEQATVLGVVLQGTGGEPPCLDVQGMITDALAESGLSETSAQCVAQAFTQGEVLQGLLGAALAGEGSTAVGPVVGSGGETALNPEIVTQLMTVMMGCLTPEELAQMGDLMGDLGS